MLKGTVVAAHVGVEKFAAQAEELGFSSFWVYDTPMVYGERAVNTSRIEFGLRGPVCNWVTEPWRDALCPERV